MYGKLLQVALNYLYLSNALLTSLEEDVCHSALRSTCRRPSLRNRIRNRIRNKLHKIYNLQDAVFAYRSLHRLYGPNGMGRKDHVHVTMRKKTLSILQ